MGMVSFSGYAFGGDYDILMPGHKGVYCDGKTHPTKGFRPYKRGFNRCSVCGAKKGIVVNWNDYDLPISNSNIKGVQSE